MDYDDNDFQSQNFQLGGEDNKFPPALRSYALPKYDLDDHLQVHLRFDGLVDTEDLLGIQNREENHWIGDFSHGSSGIEFSSNPTESCSISRRNNVWSEATSSESVEMLLKSVGQDDGIAKLDGLGSLDNQMDPTLNSYGSIPSKRRDTLETNLTQNPDKYPRSVSGLSKDGAEDKPHVECVPLTHQNENSGKRLVPDPNTVDRNFDSFLNVAGEESSLMQKETSSFVEKSSHDDRSSVASKVTEGELDSVAFQGVQVGSSATYVQNLVPGSIDGHFEVASCEKLGDLREDGSQKGKSEIPKEDAQMDDRQAADREVVCGSNNLENLQCAVLKPDSSMQITGLGEAVFSEKSSQLSKTDTHGKDGMVDDQNTGNMQQETSFVVKEGGRGPEGKSLVKDGDHMGNPSGLVVKIDCPVQVTGHSDVVFSEKPGNLLNSDGHQVERAFSIEDSEDDVQLTGSKCKKSQSVMEEKFESELVENSNNVVNLSRSVAMVCSPAESYHKKQEMAEIEGGLHSSGVSVMDATSCNLQSAVVEDKMIEKIVDDDGCAPNVISNVSGEITSIGGNDVDVHTLSSQDAKLCQTCNDSLLGVETGDVHSCDSVLEKENVQSSTHLDDTGIEIGDYLLTKKRTEASSHVESSISVKAEVQGSLMRHDDGDETAWSGDVLGNAAELASCKKLDQSNLLVDEVAEQNSVEGPPMSVSCTYHTDQEENANGVSKLCSSILKENRESLAVSNPVPVSDSEKHAVCNADAEKLVGTSALSTSVEAPVDIPQASMTITSAEECGERSSNVETAQQAVPSSENGSSHDIALDSQQYDAAKLTSRDDNNGCVPSASTEGDVLNCCKGTSVKLITLSENIAELGGDKEDGGDNINSCEPNCGSPTVISCSEPSQSEKEYQDGTAKESYDQNISISIDPLQMHPDIGKKADTGSLTACDPKEKEATEEDKSFTFMVGSLEGLSGRGTDKGLKPFTSIQPSESPQTTKKSPRTTGPCQIGSEILQAISHGRHQPSDEQEVHGTSKGIVEDKTRLVSGNAAERKTTATGRKRAKETPRAKRMTEKDGSPFRALVNSEGTSSRPMQVADIAKYASVKGGSSKGCGDATAQSSSLPDLNTSASATTLFHQPFTDLQQVQLRAQIFVYGSLIQGTPPDEACMISAFGGAGRDGGKSMWEKVLRVAVERFHSQKSPLTNLETPVHSHAGARVSKGSPLQSMALSTPVSRTSSKGAPSPVVNSSMSLSSPMWNFSTSRDGLPSNSMPRGSLLDSHQSLSPLHPYQSLHVRPFVENNTPWQSQAPGSGAWVVAPQTSPLDTSTQYSSLPSVEAVHVTSVRDLSTPFTSNMRVSPSPLVPAGHPKVPAKVNLPKETKRLEPGKHVSADQKPKRRKKNLVSEELGQVSPLTQPRIDPAASVGLTLHSNMRGTIPASPPVSVGTTGGLVSTTSPIASSTHYQTVGSGNMDQKVIFSEEICSRIEQAKLHAEDAAALAASAVRYSQGIWNQLTVQKNSGLLSETEAKLASAAVAAALAASVAKAAAAAAKVASDAGLQAKLMADEASMPKMRSFAQDSEIGLSDGGKNLGGTSASTMMSKDRTKSSSSIMAAAREAARKRLEAASASVKRAENLDAVVKAAELAAEAVSQAGTVIAMGDPIPLTLSELVEAGPEGYWKGKQISAENPVKANGVQEPEKLSIGVTGEGIDRSLENLTGHLSNKKEAQRPTNEGKRLPAKDIQRDSLDSEIESAKGVQKGFRKQKSHKTSDLAKPMEVNPETEAGLGAPSLTAPNVDERHLPMTSKGDDIKEGGLVEVVSDEDGLRGVWFSAKVLNLKDGKAFVCYTDLLQDEGPGQLKEWIPLESNDDKAPRIRIAHPMTAMKFEGTRKRRREAVGNYVWSVGDQVDAWIRDGWWEGIITEKSKTDETKLTIHFPAGGDSSIVRAWNLRPSLIWKDGQWIEWSREKSCYPNKVDTPQEKRQKLGRHEDQIDSQVDTRGSKQSRDPGLEDSREPEESRPLMLSAKEKLFVVGKSDRDDNGSDMPKMKRIGLQKEGARVVYGIPKPGKKRKFMEVSKHYIADGVTKLSEGTESVKFAKYLVPQGTLGWKNTSKADVKGKRPTGSKAKSLDSGKARNIPNRSMMVKDGSSIPILSASSGSSSQDHLLNAKASVSHEENSLEKSSNLEVGTFSNPLKVTEISASFTPQELDSDVQPSKRKAPFSDKSVAVEKFIRNTEKGSTSPGKPTSDAVEPRRSNRRIQPTSRLLEGLQSSLIISKIPPLATSKGTKAQHRYASFSRGNNRG